MVDNAGQTTGPVWVCDEFNSRRARSIPNCRRARCATSPDTSAGRPTRSVVTTTTRPPDGASIASARAHKGCRTPSDG